MTMLPSAVSSTATSGPAALEPAAAFEGAVDLALAPAETDPASGLAAATVVRSEQHHSGWQAVHAGGSTMRSGGTPADSSCSRAAMARLTNGVWARRTTAGSGKREATSSPTR